MDDLTKRIEELRKQKGLTQEQIANELDMSRNNYHRMINRGKKMSIIQLEKIAKTLGYDLQQLLFDRTNNHEEDIKIIESLNVKNEIANLKLQNTTLKYENIKNLFITYFGQILRHVIYRYNEFYSKNIDGYLDLEEALNADIDEQEKVYRIIKYIFQIEFEAPWSILGDDSIKYLILSYISKFKIILPIKSYLVNESIPQQSIQWGQEFDNYPPEKS